MEYKKYPDENCVSIIGRITSDPVVKPIGETMLLTFNVANNRPRKNDENFVNFFTVNKWGKNVDKLANILHKGTKVYIRGTVDIETWMKDEVQRSKVVITCDKLEKFADSKSFLDGTTPSSYTNETGVMPSVVSEIMEGTIAGVDDIPF